MMKNSPAPGLKFFNTVRILGLNWFIIALIGVILLAYTWPHAGAKDSAVPLSEIATVGISVIFFLYGLRLSPQKMKAGLSNWRIHLVVQLTTFVLFPLIVILARGIIGDHGYDRIWLGVFFLSSLPGTVTSAVVMVSIARGNIPAAIFNSSISTLLGVLITPFLMGLYLETSSAEYDFGPILLKLLLQVLFPVILGILLNKVGGACAEKHEKKTGYFNQIVILLIIYTAFCESFEKKMFEGYSALLLLGLGIALITLFYTVYGLVSFASRLFKFTREEKITALFCGSNKSLIHGSLMSNVLFAGSPLAGIVLLPIMMYHALQLVMGSIIAQWFARNNIRSNS
ncbi:MAG TPA: bile acid:sodium symporter family protein [Bacteroidales bacterium]|nr:bile acid:sodium symporter family protein [Bacteroidales bacterium]